MQLFNAHHYLIDLFQENKLVNTVTNVNPTAIDLNKYNVYPLVNVYLTSSQWGPIVTTYNFDVRVYQKKDLIVPLTQTKLTSGNTIDNHNECDVILQQALAKISKNHTVNLVGIPFFNYQYKTGINGIDGITTTFSITYKTDQSIC